MSFPDTHQAATLPGHRRSGTLTLGTIAVLLLVLWLPVHLSLPLGRDQAIIARVTDVMLGGGWPYVDAWDHKGPAAFLLYAPALVLGQAESALYLADVLLLAALFFAYRALATHVALPLVAPLGLLALVLCVRNGHRSVAQPDAWIGYLALASAMALLARRNVARLALWFAVGCAIGFAAMVKPVFAGLLAIPATAYATLPAPERPRFALIATTAGAAVTVLAIALPFVLAGHGQALWDAFIAFNIEGHATRIWQGAEEWLQRFAVSLLIPDGQAGMIAILLAAVFGARTMFRRHRRAALVLGSGWLAGLLAVGVQGKAFPYHFLVAHGFTAAFAAIFVAERIAAIAGTLQVGVDRTALRRHAVTTGLLIAGAWAAVMPQAVRTGEWWAMKAGAIERDAFEAGQCDAGYCAPRLRSLGAVIRDFSEPEDPIFVWGFDSAVYLFAQRPAASRFGFSYPLIGGSEAWRKRARAELMTTLRSAPPRLIVVQTNDASRIMMLRPSSAHLAAFPELAAFIAASYVRSIDLGDFLVHRRRD